MTTDKIQGKAEQAKGKIKETVGKMTDSNKMKIEGKADQVAGKAKEKMADAKSSIQKGAKNLSDKSR